MPEIVPEWQARNLGQEVAPALPVKVNYLSGGEPGETFWRTLGMVGEEGEIDAGCQGRKLTLAVPRLAAQGPGTQIKPLQLSILERGVQLQSRPLRVWL